jgi:hypothetical protein
VANILNNLGNLYSNTQRLGEAEGAYGEALELYRRLAEKHPSAFQPALGKALTVLALFYARPLVKDPSLVALLDEVSQLIAEQRGEQQKPK